MALAAGASALPAVAGMFGKKKSVRPEDFYTPEQLAAQRRLSDFSATGQYGDFKAGADVGLGYGDYNPTDLEQQGLTSLQGLLSSGVPDQYRMGDAALQDLLATSPEAIESQFNPYKDIYSRQMKEADRNLKRNASFAGNLYSTDTVRGLGDIQARGLETMSAKLADLTSEALNRRLQAIPLAFQSAQGQEALNMGRVGASQQYGSLTRNLNDASIKARDAEILRRRQELQLPIQAAQTLAGQEGRSFPEVSESPYQQLLGQIGGIAGQYATQDLFLDQYKRFFPNSTSLPQNGTGLSLMNPGFGFSRFS